MFALEIEFHDGVSAPETVLIRRSSALIGNSERSHVIVEGAGSQVNEIRITRGLGREFRCEPVSNKNIESLPAGYLDGTYLGKAQIPFGDATLRIIALDLDLVLQPDEFPDRAAIRVLRNAGLKATPLFPAVAVLGSQPIFCSFARDQLLVVGRSRKCNLRLEASDVSAEHARISTDDGKFWIEDLGSTNGTLVDGQKISGRFQLERNSLIQVGASFSLMLVNDFEAVSAVNARKVEGNSEEEESVEVSYPAIICAHENVKPRRKDFSESKLIRIGRDSTNDIWINETHISRFHLELALNTDGTVQATDLSSNGTYVWDDRLAKGEPRILPAKKLSAIDLCSGVVLALCYSARDEYNFNKNKLTHLVDELEENNEEPDVFNEQTSNESGLFSDAQPEDNSEDSELRRLIGNNSAASLKPGESVFEGLVRRAGNQAQVVAPSASELEVVNEQPADRADCSGREYSSNEDLKRIRNAVDFYDEQNDEFTDEDQDELNADRQARVTRLILFCGIAGLSLFCLVLLTWIFF